MARWSNDLLRQTSRSFYLTLRILPGAIRHQISLAYLLARTTDTIADTELVPLDTRLEALEKLGQSIAGTNKFALNFGELARQQSSPAERILLERTDDSLELLKTLSIADARMVREVLRTIISGQKLDLERFAGASEKKIIPLETEAELDDYTYRVAGCVGEFWTKICRAHLFPQERLDDASLLTNGVHFGKGLQLVNILRDLPVDLRKGRCYLPAQNLAAIGLAPPDLLEPANETKLRPLYDRYLGLAESLLADGWTYTNSLPIRCVRVRLACAWPILIGIKTLVKLRAQNVLDSRERIRISRKELKSLIFQSIIRYPIPGAWRKLFPVPSR